MTETKQPPYDAGLPVLGHFWRNRGDRLGLVRDMQRRYGDVVRYRVGPYTLTLITHPEGVKQVMKTRLDNYPKATNLAAVFGNGILTTNHETWRQQRKLIAPLFSRGFMQEAIGGAHSVWIDGLERWRGFADGERVVDVQPELHRIAFQFIIETVIGEGLRDRYEQLQDAVEFANRHLITEMYRLLKPPAWLRTPGRARFARSMTLVDEAIYGLFPSRRAALEAGDERRDLVTRLLAAQAADETGFLTDRQVRDEVATLLFAGYETTALSLSWLLHLLAEHPEAQARARAEVLEVGGGGDVAFDDLEKLEVLDRTISEALRLYPAGWAWSRKAVEDDEVCGYHVGAGSVVLISPYVTHRREDLWEDPDRFEPDRFLPDRVKERHPFAYFPFGAGARTCVGFAFARLEMKQAMATLLRRFEVLPGDRVPEPLPLATLATQDGVRLRVRAL